jgi:hypothetical protein
MIAALYVDPAGVYPRILGPDACWDEARDARLYDGPHPVVAHPPCQLWGALAASNYGRALKDPTRKLLKPAWLGGSDGLCFENAINCVHMYGGVVEHPATSHAWAYHMGRENSPRVSERGWRQVGPNVWVCVVAQSAYGHRCEKLTGLAYRGERPPFELRWERPEGTHQIGYQDQRGKARNKPTCPKRETSATPQAFASELISLAEWSRP